MKVNVIYDELKETAWSEVVEKGVINVHLNPKLKDNKKLRDIIIRHELYEAQCFDSCSDLCHVYATIEEPKGARQKIAAVVKKPSFKEEFDDLDYTRDALIKQLGLIQLHGTDGSAVDAGCGCIEDKHLYLIEALSEEGATIATDPKEKEFYAQLADLSRNLRKRIDAGDFNMHGVMSATMRARENPRTRAFLPHNLTECEKAHPEVQRKLARAIKALEIQCCGVHTTDYSKCTCNPVAVARASVPCP